MATKYILHDPGEARCTIREIAVCRRRACHGITVDDRQPRENEHAANRDADPRLSAGRGANVDDAESNEKWIRAGEDRDEAEDNGAARSQVGVGI